MGQGIDQEKLKAVADAVIADIAEWRTAHPVATFDEIEAATTERLRPLREQVLSDTIHSSAQASFARSRARPVCPECGERLQANGRKRRTVVTQQGEEIELERTAGRCPRCRAGVFPPGS